MVNRYKILTQCLSHKNKLPPTPHVHNQNYPMFLLLKKKKKITCSYTNGQALSCQNCMPMNKIYILFFQLNYFFIVY